MTLDYIYLFLKKKHIKPGYHDEIDTYLHNAGDRAYGNGHGKAEQYFRSAGSQ